MAQEDIGQNSCKFVKNTFIRSVQATDNGEADVHTPPLMNYTENGLPLCFQFRTPVTHARCMCSYFAAYYTRSLNETNTKAELWKLPHVIEIERGPVVVLHMSNWYSNDCHTPSRDGDTSLFSPAMHFRCTAPFILTLYTVCSI
jgi:hypothetical protein